MQIVCKLSLIYTLLHVLILFKTRDFPPFLRIFLLLLIPQSLLQQQQSFQPSDCYQIQKRSFYCTYLYLFVLKFHENRDLTQIVRIYLYLFVSINIYRIYILVHKMYTTCIPFITLIIALI